MTTVDEQTSLVSSPTAPSPSPPQWAHSISQRYQHLLDKSTPYVLGRWIAFSIIALIYAVRVFMLQGFFLITYALGIYILNLLIGFLSPQVDPEIEELESDDGPTLPTRVNDEFRPFVRRLPEFKFWYAITLAFSIAFVLTFFNDLDVPVFWPILFVYWLVLFISTMKRQAMHMIKYKYNPFTLGRKQNYSGRRAASADEADST